MAAASLSLEKKTPELFPVLPPVLNSPIYVENMEFQIYKIP